LIWFQQDRDLTEGRVGLRVVALLAVYNEQRFIGHCLEHLRVHGVDAYLIDNDSTDKTVEIAERYRGRGLIGIESFPREGTYEWGALLRRKEELAGEIDADWLIHLDADEIRLPPSRGELLSDALARVDREGYNAVNFMEFTFVPTREDPDHDHPRFEQTLRTYYPFLPIPVHRLTAWKAGPVELAWSGGHRARFPNLRMWPQPFPMKHYLFLSVAHAEEKYANRSYAQHEVDGGWHGWRARVTAAQVARLPSRSELRVSRDDDDLDASQPRERHLVEELWQNGDRPASTAGP
jgi:glycosyltransferase involved in cell wall biosynthesis